ncbi:RecB family exonuclease [Tepidibacter sp. Z1-5]|uniref:RecB family exonuclease n=1 Tax=Tepidibacter sp. Z1-5 TaxID=3134138 RepID=UPI0030C44325
MSNRKLYLSNTSIQTFLQCKQKFKYKYIDKMSVSESNPNKYLSFGNSIHTTLANFNLIADSKYKQLDILHNLLRKNWIRDGYESKEEEREFGLRGLDMLSNYYSKPQDKGKKNLIIEEMIYKNNDDYVLCGKLDKVYIDNKDSVEIIDYKTGNTVTPVDNLQLSIYLILAKEKLNYYPSKVSLYYLSKNKKITNEIDENSIKNSNEIVSNLCEKIKKEENFKLNFNSHCKNNCEYYKVCDASKIANSSNIESLDNLDENFKNFIF